MPETPNYHLHKNASGAMPDATLITNLNADLLGGYHASAFLFVNGALDVSSRIITSATTILPTDCIITCNSATPFTITLPAATGSSIIYFISNENTGVITVSRAGSDLIAGQTSQKVFQWETLMLHDNAAGVWIIL